MSRYSLRALKSGIEKRANMLMQKKTQLVPNDFGIRGVLSRMNRQLFVSQVICLLAISLPLASCLALPQVETPIHESSRGRIILKTFPEGFNHASHPSPISLLSIQDILHGLRIQEDKALLATLVSGEGQVLPVFSEEDLEFFGPFIHDALSQATSEEYVEFERRKPQAIPPTLTRGTLYMTNASAHIGLDKFQADMRQKEVSSKASFSPISRRRQPRQRPQLRNYF